MHVYGKCRRCRGALSAQRIITLACCQREERCRFWFLPQPQPSSSLQEWAATVAERAGEVARAGAPPLSPRLPTGTAPVCQPMPDLTDRVLNLLLQPTLQWPRWAEAAGQRADDSVEASRSDAAEAMPTLVAALCKQFGRERVLAVELRRASISGCRLMAVGSSTGRA